MPKGPFTSAGGQTSLKTVSGGRDARTGLGYGVLKPTKQLPRQLGSEFPYYEEEDSADEEPLDDNTMSAVSTKYQTYTPSDYGRAAGSDPFYFAGGNTKLSDCFWRIDKVLQEVAAFSDSMSSVPQMSGRPAGGLGSGAAFPYPGGGGSNFKRTGTTQGWSKPPPMNVMQADEKEVQDQEDEILTLKDLADKNMKDRGESTQRPHTYEGRGQ